MGSSSLNHNHFIITCLLITLTITLLRPFLCNKCVLLCHRRNRLSASTTSYSLPLKKLRVFGSYQASYHHLLLLRSRAILWFKGCSWLISALSFSPSALKATPFYGIWRWLFKQIPMGSPVSDGDHVVFVISHLLAIASSRENGFLFERYC